MQPEQGETETLRFLLHPTSGVRKSRSMVSLAPLKFPFPNAMPPAAGTKHERDDNFVSPIVASISKKRVRFVNAVVAQKDFEQRQESEDRLSDSDASTSTTTITHPKKPRVKGASAASMFKKFVVNALDERAAVCSLPLASCRKMRTTG